jgi:hypothetical protein
LLLGSDGRDDIILTDGEINDDQELFLRHVENGKANLELIYQEILKSGNLYDDLSLMRIEFKK